VAVGAATRASQLRLQVSDLPAAYAWEEPTPVAVEAPPGSGRVALILGIASVPLSLCGIGLVLGLLAVIASRGGGSRAGGAAVGRPSPGALSAGALPTGALSAGALPAGAPPTGALSTGAPPTGALPAGAPPTGALSTGAPRGGRPLLGGSRVSMALVGRVFGIIGMALSAAALAALYIACHGQTGP